jgi:hypothetical protein
MENNLDEILKSFEQDDFLSEEFYQTLQEQFLAIELDMESLKKLRSMLELSISNYIHYNRYEKNKNSLSILGIELKKYMDNLFTDKNENSLRVFLDLLFKEHIKILFHVIYPQIPSSKNKLGKSEMVEEIIKYYVKNN